MAWLDSIVEHWRLDEASGNRAGRHAGITLTDVNTVTQAAGKIGNAALFTAANSERLTAADSAALSTGNISYAWALWVYFVTVTGEQWLLGKLTGDTDREYVIRINAAASGRMEASMSTGGSPVNLVATNFGALSANTWYFVGLQYDAATDVLSIGVNDVWNTQSSVGGPSDSTGALYFGSEVGTGKYLNARLDSATFWKRVLTAAEWTELYNGGNGLNYPFSQAAAGALTSSGALARSARKALAGAQGLAGALARRTARALGGASTPSGALVRLVSKPLAGAVSSAGALARSVGRALAGALDSSGALARATAFVISLGGTLAATGTLARRIGRALSGLLGLAGALASDAPVQGLVHLTLADRSAALTFTDRAPALALAERGAGLALAERAPALTVTRRTPALTLPEL